MARLTQVIIPDAKWLRPTSRAEALELIELTFRHRDNRWNADEQAEFCGEVGVHCDWRRAPTPCLFRILRRLERYRMILFDE